MKHPAPWTIKAPSRNEPGHEKCIVAADGMHVVCFGHDYEDYGGFSDDDAMNLVVAAPDLLAACKLAMDAFEKNHAIDWADVQRAIDKAEGRPA